MNGLAWVAGIAAIAALGMLVGVLERESVAVTAANERIAYDHKVDLRPQDRIWLSYPLACDAIVTTSGPQGIDRTRCYMRKGRK